MSDKNREYFYKMTLAGITTLYIVVFFAHCYLRFKTFGYFDWDLAVYDQIIWNLGRGDFFSSLLGVNFLGHHAHFLAFPVAVIYKLCPHPLTLMFLQTAALGLAVAPLYLLARKVLGFQWAFLVCCLYLLNHGVGYTNIYEFHFTSFAPLILFTMFYFFFIEKYVYFLCLSVLALLCQENFPFFIFTFGLYAMVVRRSPRWWLPLLIGSAGYFILYMKVVVPALNPGNINFALIYSHWGHSYGEILRNLLLQPISALQYMFTIEKINWLWNVFSPFSFIPLLSPGYLALVGPLFLQRLLSNRLPETMIFYHYLAEILPFIFLAFLFGLKRALAYPNTRKLMLAVVVFTVALFQTIRLGPHFSLFSSRRTMMDDVDHIKEQWVKGVPPDYSVVATFEFLSHLSHRKALYSFQYIYSGSYILSNKTYVLNKRIDQALIDFDDHFMIGSFYKRDNYKKIQDFLAYQQFSVKDVVNNMVLFGRGGKDQKVLYEVLKAPPTITHPLDIKFGSSLRLGGYDIRRKGDYLELVFYWHALERPGYDLSMAFGFLNASGALTETIVSPVCYRIYPTQAWDKNMWIADHKYLLIPSKVASQDFVVYTGFKKMDSSERLPAFELKNVKGE